MDVGDDLDEDVIEGEGKEKGKRITYIISPILRNLIQGRSIIRIIHFPSRDLGENVLIHGEEFRTRAGWFACSAGVDDCCFCFGSIRKRKCRRRGRGMMLLLLLEEEEEEKRITLTVATTCGSLSSFTLLYYCCCCCNGRRVG